MSVDLAFSKLVCQRLGMSVNWNVGEFVVGMSMTCLGTIFHADLRNRMTIMLWLCLVFGFQAFYSVLFHVSQIWLRVLWRSLA